MDELFEKKDINVLLASLEEAYEALYTEIDNNRKRDDGYLFADLIKQDKTVLNLKASMLISVCNEIKKIKPFNPKKK